MPCSKCGTEGHNIRTCTWKPKKNKRDIKDCCVCYEQLETGNGLVTTPCGHNYCTHCFANWMRKSGTCAYCREEVCELPPVINHLISDDAQEHFIDGLLEGSELMAEIKQDIRKQIVDGIYNRHGIHSDDVDDMIDTIHDIMETFNPYYIMTMIGYDTMAIVSESTF
jgi:hypothetical protein